MKILQVNKLYPPWIGGVESAVRDITVALLARGYDCDVLCCRDSGKRRVEKQGGTRIFRATSFGIFFRTPISLDFFRLWRQKKSEYDLIAIHHPFPLVWLAVVFFPSQVPFVVHYHSDIIKQRFLRRLFAPLIRHMLKKSARIVVSNPNMVESSSVLREFRDKIAVAPFAVDVDALHSVIMEKRVKRLQEKYGRFVLFVGRLRYYKGVRYLVEAIAQCDRRPLVIIGEGDELQQLRQLADLLGVGERVIFLPPQSREDLLHFLTAAEMLVLSSVERSETFGIVLLEAIALGTPIISTDIGTGTSYVNENGQTGFVVPPRDSVALANAIKQVYENGKLCYTDVCIGRAKQMFSPTVVYSRLEHIYRSCVII